MEILIHRGTNEIGGTCIQLSTQNTSILLDVGLPLNNQSKTIDFSKIRKDAILISHPHQDHYGHIKTIDSFTPVYIGEVGKKLIEATLMFLGKELPVNNFKFIMKDESFCIGDFKITPYLVDHSAVDAFAFLIQVGNLRLFYSGDFRAHGRKSILFNRIIENPPSDIDVLFLEGTMMNRTNGDFPDEQSVENKITEIIMNQKNISFIISSSQNIDRLVSAYRACLKTGKIFIIDLYTAWVLEQLKIISKNVPSLGWDKIRVYADFKHDQVLKKNKFVAGNFREYAYQYRIKKEEIHEDPSKYLYLSKMSKFKLIDLFKVSDESHVNIIYSQWLGYLNGTNNECYGAEQMNSYKNDAKINFHYTHTSGHATIDDLKTFADALNPKKIIPIHTEYKESYIEYVNNVCILDDGEVLKI